MQSEKITKKVEAVSQRWYEDACAAAHALDLVGERWALLVMRELVFGPRRFNDLRGSLPGISANVLTQRLEGLEAAGVVRRRRLAPPAAAQVYELTEWGRESEPIFMALGRWAARSPAHDPTLPLSTASLLLSLRTMLDAERAAGIEARVGLRLGDETFLCRLGGGAVAITAEPLNEAEAVLSGLVAAVAAAIYGGRKLDALQAEGALGIEGDLALARWFVTLFPLPAKAGRGG